MDRNEKKFSFVVENAEVIYEKIAELTELKEEKVSFLEFTNCSFLPPIEDVAVNSIINFSVNTLSLLGIIKLDAMSCRKDKDLNFQIPVSLAENFNLKSVETTAGTYSVILDKDDNFEFTLKNIQNFGIYVFAGRADLSHYEAYSPAIAIDGDLENFKKKLEKFAKLIELLVNEVYKSKNVNLNDNIEYKLTAHSENIKKKAVVDSKKEMPEALKRFYSKINKTVN